MKNNKGFSLVELIVVIAIMAILAAVAIVSFSIYIKKANDAADEDYVAKLKYAALIVATEHQFELVDVEYEDIIDGPEDIKLIVYNPLSEENEYYTYETDRDILQEVYDIVGDWTFSYACDHANCTREVITPATCLTTGLARYSGCGKEEVIPIDVSDTGHVWSNPEPMGGTNFYQCTHSLKYKDENGIEHTTDCRYRKKVSMNGNTPVVSIVPPEN